MTKQEAQELVTQVCKDYRRSQPKTVQVYQSHSRRSSSGRYWREYRWHSQISKLHVTFGTGGHDHLETLLHELSHHLCSKTKRVGHSVKFWQTHYELCARYGVAQPDHARNVRYKAKAEDGLRKFALTT